MSYQSQREKVRDFIEKNILEEIGERALNYHKILSVVAAETSTPLNIVEDVVKSFIGAGKLVEVRELILSPDSLVKYRAIKEQKIKKELEEVGLK